MARRLAADPAPPPGLVGLTHLLLVRHAHAGDRAAWTAPDVERPLSDRGRRQAEGIVALLAAIPFSEVWSSPAVRCVQTVEPLAAARGLAVEKSQLLLEGADPGKTMAWIENLVDEASVVACTHGDLIPALLDDAAAAGCVLPKDVRWGKGSTWVLERDAGAWLRATYLPAAG